MAYKLRPYQQDALDASIKFIKEGKKQFGLVVAPTGAGKSLIVANIAKAVDEPILCIQPSKELLQQNYEKYTSYGLEASMYSASVGTKEISDVTFATPKSVHNDINLFRHFRYICVDEAHLGSKKKSVLDKIITSIKPKKVIGLTATPIYLRNTLQGSMLKMMNRTRDSLFKSIIHITQIKELTEQDYWSKLLYENEYVDTSMLHIKEGSSEFTKDSIQNMYKANNTGSNILRQISKLRKEGRKSILVFVPSVEEAKLLSESVGKAAFVSGETPKKERERIVEGFKDRSIKVVFNVNVLSTGFDHPELDAIITARATASMAVYYQQIGRGCRIAEGKKDCKIVDLAGNAFRFGRVEDVTFENYDNYGWAMFCGNKLLTDIPMSSSYTVTKEEIDGKKKVQRNTGTIHDVVIPFGKHRNKTILKIWEIDPTYLSWLASEKFEPRDEEHFKIKNSACELIKLKLLLR